MMASKRKSQPITRNDYEQMMACIAAQEDFAWTRDAAIGCAVELRGEQSRVDNPYIHIGRGDYIIKFGFNHSSGATLGPMSVKAFMSVARNYCDFLAWVDSNFVNMRAKHYKPLAKVEEQLALFE